MITYGNGLIPVSLLTRLSTGHRLALDAARSYERMATAFRRDLGYALAVTDAYRDLADQVAVKALKGPLAAKPGTSEHGWARALDLASGVPNTASPAHRWMDAHASEYGWVNPAWAQDDNPRNGAFEPWHWEYVAHLDQHAGGTFAARPAPRKEDDAMIYRATGERTAFGVYAHNGGWVELASRAEYDNLKAAGVPEVWVEPATLKNLIADARA